MRQLVVLSGKGGTGKTSVAAALADVAARHEQLVLVDADADAANLGLLLDPELVERTEFQGSPVAVIDDDGCLHCGICADTCRFGAIEHGVRLHIDPTACEGCGACVLACPGETIRQEPRQAGWQQCSKTRLGPLFDGLLLPGQENSGKLVAALRAQAVERAGAEGIDLILIDGPPGMGCSAIAASTGADLALLVTEPSLSALSDLERVLGMVRHFELPAVAVLNKADIHPVVAERVRRFLAAENVPLLGEIPYHAALREAVVSGRPVTSLGVAEIDAVVASLWDGLRAILTQPATAG